MSEQLKNLLSDIVLENELGSSSLCNILKACSELQNFKNKDISSINQFVSNLNANINVHQNHQLLNTIIQQCTEDVLLSHAITWMSLCIKSNDISSVSIGALDYTNLNLLISKTTHSNDIKKQFIASILPKFMLKLDLVPSNLLVCTEKLKCLESVLRFYNGPCFSHYKTVEKFLLNGIEQHHSTESLIIHIGLCYTLLSQLGGGGHQTSLYKDNWANGLDKLVACTHKVLDQMFEDIPEIQTVPIPMSIRSLDVKVPFLSYYPNTENTSKLHASSHLLRAFKVLSTLIRAALGAPFPAPKTINVEAILSVVARVLSITPLTLSSLDVTSGHAILLSLLPEVHAKAHSILNTLIIVAGRNLIPHSLYICKLSVHTLKWTNSPEGARYTLDRPYRELRCAAYKTLHSWLTLAGYASNIELVAEELVDYLLADIVYEKQGVTLTTVMKKTRKRHKTKVGLESVDNNSGGQRALPVVGGTTRRLPGDSLCAQAHGVLADLLGSAGCLLKPDLIQNIQTALAGLLLALSTGCRDVYPYSTCVTSRRALYSTLEACLLYSNPRSPDLAHYASVFYRAGLADSDVEIRSLCQRGVEILEKVQHPKADSLNFVIENLEEEKLKLLGPYGGKVGRQMNGHVSDDAQEDSDDEEMSIDHSEPVEKKGKHNVESAAASGQGNKEQPSNSQGKKDKRQDGKKSVGERENEEKKRKRNELEKEDSVDSVDESLRSQNKKRKRDKHSRRDDAKTSGTLSKKPQQKGGKKDSKMSNALAKIAKKPANFISLEGVSDSDSDSDASDTSEDFEGLDSDGSEDNVAMMFMNAMMGGNNSDFSFDDDDDDDDDDNSEEEEDSSMFEEEENDDDEDSDSEMEESSEDDRPGVIITEIVDEEEVTETAVVTTVGKDKESVIGNSEEKRDESDVSEYIAGKSRSASESSEVNAVKGNKRKNKRESDTGNEEMSKKDGGGASKKTDGDGETKEDVKRNSGAKDSSTSSTKPSKGKLVTKEVTGKSKDEKKGGKEDVGLNNNDGKPKNDIDCIDLGGSDDSDASSKETRGNTHNSADDKGKITTSRIESEEIILSSDNSRDSVMPLQKTGAETSEVEKGGIDENEEETEGEEEIEDCLKLFSSE